MPTVLNVQVVIKKALADAVDSGLIARNPQRALPNREPPLVRTQLLPESLFEI
jgi:hypothetical protein